ncbi:hypothetical protein [Brevibacillus fulvus]
MNEQRGKIRYWKRYFSLLMIGVCLGGAGMIFWYGHQLEELMLENRSLKLVNERLYKDLASLKQTQKAAQKRQDAVIELIRVQIDEPKPHAIIETEVIRRLEKDLAPLKGKKAEQLVELPPLLHELLRRREYVIEGNMVEVRLKTVVIVSRVLSLTVTAEVKHDGTS